MSQDADASMELSGARARRGEGAPLLEVRGLTKRFNGVTAVNGVDTALYSGELLSLIGPNGSGKTTLFNCVTGFLQPDEGEVYFRGEAITGERPDRIVLRGISRTFQNVRIFPGLTVVDNLMVSLQQHQEDSLLQRALHTRRIRTLEAEASDPGRSLTRKRTARRLRRRPHSSRLRVGSSPPDGSVRSSRRPRWRSDPRRRSRDPRCSVDAPSFLLPACRVSCLHLRRRRAPKKDAAFPARRARGPARSPRS